MPGDRGGRKKGYPLNLESYKFKLNSYNKDKGAKKNQHFFFQLYHLACGTFPAPLHPSAPPSQGSKPRPLQWKHGVFTPGLPGKSQRSV